jgi:hypothetical protein
VVGKVEHVENPELSVLDDEEMGHLVPNHRNGEGEREERNEPAKCTSFKGADQHGNEGMQQHHQHDDLQRSRAFIAFEEDQVVVQDCIQEFDHENANENQEHQNPAFGHDVSGLSLVVHCCSLLITREEMTVLGGEAIFV